MSSENVKTGVYVVKWSQKLVDVIIDEIVFELSHEDWSGVCIQKLNDFPRLVEFFLDHKAAHDQSKTLAAEVIELLINESKFRLLRLAVVTIPWSIPVEDLLLGDQHLLLLLIELKLSEAFPVNNRVWAGIFWNPAANRKSSKSWLVLIRCFRRIPHFFLSRPKICCDPSLLSSDFF